MGNQWLNSRNAHLTSPSLIQPLEFLTWSWFRLKSHAFFVDCPDMFYRVLWYFQLLLGSKPVGLPRCFPSQGFSLWDCCLKLLIQWVLLPVPGKFPYQLQFLIVLRCDKHRHGPMKTYESQMVLCPPQAWHWEQCTSGEGWCPAAGYKNPMVQISINRLGCPRVWSSSCVMNFGNLEVFMASPTGYLAKIDAVSAS